MNFDRLIVEHRDYVNIYTVRDAYIFPGIYMVLDTWLRDEHLLPFGTLREYMYV